MKFANIRWQDTIRGNQAAINYGDNLQFLAIDGLYEEMGVTEIQYLDMHELTSYRGEQLILPLNWTLFDANYMVGNYLNISPDIKPVFLGMALCGRDDECYFCKENINYLKQYEPIGCRDEYTYQKLIKHGIDAYINGCVSVTLPRRKDGGKKIILVDAPIELEGDIQKKLHSEYECMTQQVYMNIEDAREKLQQIVRDHYKYIMENAGVVITSRLHIASPCIAMGIPVIFARKEVDFRFSWLDKFIKLYSEKEFKNIDWKPQIPVYEDIKKDIRHNDIARILGKQTEIDNKRIHKYFLNRNRHVYSSFQKSLIDLEKLKRYLCEEWTDKYDIEYVLWGVNDATKEIHFYISKNFPNAKLIGVIDDYRNDCFAGLKCVKHTKIEIKNECYVLVTAVAASNMAYHYFKEKRNLYLSGDVFCS